MTWQGRKIERDPRSSFVRRNGGFHENRVDFGIPVQYGTPSPSFLHTDARTGGNKDGISFVDPKFG
jgi:hypothetical protein